MKNSSSRKKTVTKNAALKAPEFFDYIIIGSGLAGLNAALQASLKGTVLIMTKKKLADCNTYYAQGGIAAVLGQTDDFQKHIEDTMKAGSYHNDKNAVTFIVKKGPAAIQRLLKLGLSFTKDAQGKIDLGREGGHQEHRIIHSGDFSGKAIEETFIKNIKKNPDITVFENTFAKDLLIERKTCYGVEVIRKKNPLQIFGRKIILATGGLGQIYERTTNPAVATGDGLAMAKRAGCKLKDLEFIQFHPTAFKERKNPQFLLSEALRGEGALLRNAQGEKFMSRYHPSAELAPRDIVSRAIFEEEKTGPVYLDISHYGAKVKKHFPKISAYLQKQGYDLSRDLIPITPAAHFSCGGIQTNLKGETAVKNLYAFGEVASTGLHGANRLASNSLLEALVMSNEILNVPREKKPKNPNFKIVPTRHPPTKIKQYSTLKIRHTLQEIMWHNVGIVRTAKKLKLAQKKITSLQRILNVLLSKNGIQPNLENLETNNMVEIGLEIIKGALKRKKSLGGHYLTK